MNVIFQPRTYDDPFNVVTSRLVPPSSEELDTLRVILAENLSPPLPNEDIQRLEQHLVVDAVYVSAPRPLPLPQLVHGQHAALLPRLLDVLLDLARPLLRLAPVHEHDVPLAPSPLPSSPVTAAAGRVLDPPVPPHEVEQLADVGHAQPAVQPAVVEEVRVGGGGEAEPEDAVVARVGQDEGGPLGQLGVVGGQAGNEYSRGKRKGASAPAAAVDAAAMLGSAKEGDSGTLSLAAWVCVGLGLVAQLLKFGGRLNGRCWRGTRLNYVDDGGAEQLEPPTI
ncbi:unnamed protein product [Clonostachys solani]|uniref:Uncharacterized protein n=1 Tax=Clonostachys solani TaxID=160281 RepID=A0A9N9ZCP7_9HYPO|nr:unnamed protein product [Clonostachys solani]